MRDPAHRPAGPPAGTRRLVRSGILALTLGGLLLGTGGCGGIPGLGSGRPEGDPRPQADLTVRPAGGAKNVRPNQPVRVAVAHGKLRKVSVTAEPTTDKDQKPGLEIDGTVTRGGTVWKSTEPLLPDVTYTVRATAVDENGLASSVTTTFATLNPDSLLQAKAVPLDGETVGVGMPIILYWSNPVADEFKDDVERRLELDMSQPVEGAWHWMDDETLHFRPREYWPAGEHVTLRTNLIGLRAGEGLWGDQSRTIEFEVGERHVSVVDADEHTMTVRRGGEVVKTFPISAGEPENPSSSGTLVALAKEGHIVMNSSSYGVPVDSPEGYSVPTDWNVRLTWSGQFVHSAPWSLGAQGERNVSHGCVNMSPSDAEWFYHFTNRGDVIKVKGTSRDVRWRNGWTDWNMSWDEWVEGSALNRSVNGAAT